MALTSVTRWEGSWGNKRLMIVQFTGDASVQYVETGLRDVEFAALMNSGADPTNYLIPNSYAGTKGDKPGAVYQGTAAFTAAAHSLLAIGT